MFSWFCGYFQEYAQGNQYQGAQKLVGASEQRPDIGVADLCQNVAEYQSNQRGYIFVAEYLSPAFRVLHVITENSSWKDIRPILQTESSVVNARADTHMVMKL